MVHQDNGKKWAIKSQKDMEKCKCISLSERSQSGKTAYCMISTLWHSRKGETVETVKRSVASRFSGEGVLGQWNYPVLYCNGGYLSLYIC